MTRPVTITYDGAFSLQTLNAQMAADERSLGPLIRIAYEGKQTLLTYDGLGGKVSVPARLVSDGVPANATEVARGQVLIESQPADVIAVRPGGPK